MRAGSNQTVVALFPGALGDLLLALATLRHLRAVHEGAQVVVAVDRRLGALALAAGIADRVEAVDGTEIARTLGGGSAPHWWGRATHLYAWMGGRDPAARLALARHADAATFAHVVRGDGPTHAALEYASGIGWRATWEEVVTGSRLGPRAFAPADRAPLPERPLIVHRGAGASAKRWCPAGFERVAEGWRDRGGAVVDLRGPADAHLPPLPGAIVVTPEVADLPGVLAGATAFVGNDSGPAHVAGAVGIPGVVVFGPTSPSRWRPASARVVAVRADRRGDGFGRLDAGVVVDALLSATLHA